MAIRIPTNGTSVSTPAIESKPKTGGGSKRAPDKKSYAKPMPGQSPYTNGRPNVPSQLMHPIGNMMAPTDSWLAGLPGQGPIAQVPAQMQHPMAMTPGNGFQDIMDRATRIAMANHGNVGGMPSTMENRGNYGGFEGNYFPDAMHNMHLAPGAQTIQGAMPNMGKAQGFPDNFFPDAKMNSPYGRSPAMNAVTPKAPMANVQIPGRSQTKSPGIALDGSRIRY